MLLNKTTFKKKECDELLEKCVNLFYRRFCNSFSIKKDTKNLIELTNFFKSFDKLSMEDFIKKIQKLGFAKRNQLSVLYLLSIEKESGLSILINNHGSDKLQSFYKKGFIETKNVSKKIFNIIVRTLEKRISFKENIKMNNQVKNNI